MAPATPSSLVDERNATPHTEVAPPNVSVTDSSQRQVAADTLVNAQLIVCRGCCCGRVDRGHPEVPVDALKAAWKEHGLRQRVHLTVSGCLGPCKRSNVALLITGGEQIWLGELREAAHYEALVGWARAVFEHGENAELPTILQARRFERWADSI